HSETSKFDLCVSMWDAAGKITTEIEYNTDIFEDRSIRRLARHFENLLHAVTNNPDQPIGDLPLMDLEERHQIEQWSGPKAEYPRDQTVHELFEEQVALHPNKTALLFENEQVTYSALNARANQITEHLQAAGVRRGDFVGVCLERSPDLIAALIGILKTG